MKKMHFYITSFWIILGIFFVFFSYRLGLGQFLEPGPGLFSFGLGFIIILLGLYKLISTFFLSRKNGEGSGIGHKVNLFGNIGRLVFLVVVLFSYALLLQRLGFLLTTFICLALLLRIAGYTRWTLITVYAAIISVITYAVFSYLGVIFPHGILDLGFLFAH